MLSILYPKVRLGAKALSNKHRQSPPVSNSGIRCPHSLKPGPCSQCTPGVRIRKITLDERRHVLLIDGRVVQREEPVFMQRRGTKKRRAA
jgi:hypothetical protein